MGISARQIRGSGYPAPTSAAAAAALRGNRKRDTRPELAVRSLLHKRGMRFRVNHMLSLCGLRVRPDIVFPRLRVAVFVDGCFWHQCPVHGNTPKKNTQYWEPKLARNVARDRAVDEGLAAAGWQVLRFWEHASPEEVSEAVERVVAGRREVGSG